MRVTPISNITIRKVADLIEALRDKELILQDGESLFYRGESIDNKKTKLKPKAFRPEYAGKERITYYDLITNFPNEFEPLTRLSRLAKMQHYGNPTRLLDLTSNPLIALYFACISNTDKDGYFYIFKTDKISNYDSDKVLMLSCLPHLSKAQQDSLRTVLKSFIADSGADERITPEFIQTLKIIGETRNDYPADDSNGWFQFERLIGEAFKERASFMRYNTVAKHLLSNYIVRPLIQNERHKKQDGLFMIFGLTDETANDESNDMDIKIFSYRIENKGEIIKELQLLGINEASIFCDIESRVKFLNPKKQENEQEAE